MLGCPRAMGLGDWAAMALTLSGVAACGAEPQFRRPTPQEALKFLKALPRVWRNTRDFDPKAPSKKILIQLWENFTVEDLKTLKVVHPGGHVDDPDAPGRFSRRHLRVKPSDWRYFTVFEQAEAFEAFHDMEGITDECFFYLGKLPQSVTRIHLAMSEATGEGVKHLRSLKNLKALNLLLSRTIGDVALVHAGDIASLEHIDVNGCPRITGSGVAALSKLKNLKVLKIGGCSLSDASLANFRALSIEELDLSDNVAEWVIKYRGGGQHRFTVSFAGLKSLLASRGSLPNLKRLIVRRGANLRGGGKPVTKAELLTDAQRAQLAKLRPGLQVK